MKLDGTKFMSQVIFFETHYLSIFLNPLGKTILFIIIIL